ARITSMSAPVVPTSVATSAKSVPVRHFGRFELRLLLGKSARSMSWLVSDPAGGRELMLSMPRVQPADEPALALWLDTARRAQRLDHPRLAPVVEVDVHEHWPYIACERGSLQTLAERIAVSKPSPTEAVDWSCDALLGLAFAHESGVAHHDLQPYNLLVDDNGKVAVMAFASAMAPPLLDLQGGVVQPGDLQAHRMSAERDLLSLGVLMHRLLAGEPALEEPDIGRVIERLQPAGRESLRLPWTTPHPVPEPLRIIVNRSTDRHQRLRYLSARTMLRALDGWREAASHDTGGPLGLLLDRLRSVGTLPALPGIDARVARLVSMETQRTDEIAKVILADMALSFELLRNINSAQVQGTQVSGNGPVLTIRRAVALLGVNGLKQAAAGLRSWPGPLSETAAASLDKVMQEVRLAGFLAQLLRPAGYDPEVVYLIALMQNLGRLLTTYHFPDDAEQIAALMRPQPVVSQASNGSATSATGSTSTDSADAAGMSQDAASYAVMGIDIDTLALAVVKQWGMNEDVIHMVRRLPLDRPVRAADSDADLLRAAASCGNEMVDVVSRLTAVQQAAAMSNIANRYHRLLGVSARDLADALQEARELLRSGVSPAREATAPVRAPTSEAPPAQPPSVKTETPPTATAPGGTADKPLSALRSRATAASSNLRQP
ncbi:MAG: hypothetical protein JWQ11_1860, partial [Rhizobacter sp.]|nr:hypothetical protein [Rhizobacter sp.]